MRIFLNQNLNDHHQTRIVLVPFIIFIVLFLLGDLLTTTKQLGMTPSSIAEYYRGDENKFIEPKGVVLILEETHVRSFLFAFSLLVFCSLLLQTTVSESKKSILIVTSFTTGIMDSLGGIFIAYVHPSFAFLKILSFLGLYLSFVIMILLITSNLWKRKKDSPSGGSGGKSVLDPEFRRQHLPKSAEPKSESLGSRSGRAGRLS